MTKVSCRAFSATVKQKTLGILGVPFSKGQNKDGPQLAPDFLRENHLLKHLKNTSNGNLIIKDYGNLKFDVSECTLKNEQVYQNMKNFNEFLECNKALINKVKMILKESDEILTIGGDHAIGFGAIAGHLQHRPNLSVVWIDAHADININTSSASGHIHGMPVSFLLPEFRAHWKNIPLDKIAPKCLQKDQLIYIGLRDVDPYEQYLLKKLGIRAYDMDAIDKYGIAKITEMTLDAINPNNKIHISFDIDALDSMVAPSTGTPVHAGMTLRESIYVLNGLRSTNQVEGFDLVEINPKLGSPEDVKKTFLAGMELLKHVYATKQNYDENLHNENIFK